MCFEKVSPVVPSEPHPSRLQVSVPGQDGGVSLLASLKDHSTVSLLASLKDHSTVDPLTSLKAVNSTVGHWPP